MFNFPFSADVWGTVSDWVMIFVTAITAYFLWKTLKSQKDVQDTQNSLLKIEQLRVREDFKPNLKYSRDDVQMNTNEPETKVICIAVRNVSISPALNVKPRYDFNVSPKIKWIMFKPNPWTLAHDGEHLQLYFVVPYQEGEHLNCQIYLTIEYEDVAGTKYAQLAIFDAFGGREEFRTYDPHLIEK